MVRNESSHSPVTFIDTWLANIVPPVLWCCWLGGRKGIRRVKKTEWWVRRGYLSGVKCRLACDPADATATHCLTHLGSPGKGQLNWCVSGERWFAWAARWCTRPAVKSPRRGRSAAADEEQFPPRYVTSQSHPWPGPYLLIVSFTPLATKSLPVFVHWWWWKRGKYFWIFVTRLELK